MSTISEEDIEREVRTLKNLRRRSASSPGPGELPLDPDLPPADAFQAGHHHHPTLSSNDDISLAPPPGSDQSLFWVPAHLHPELAPGEFRAFLKQHTQVNPTAVEAGETGEASLSRSPSWLARSRSLSGGLGRQKSMLSRQYTPRHGDKVEEEQTPQLTRRGSNRYAGRNIDTGPTLQELQNLEELVKHAEESGDPNEMRRVLRRSVTLTTGVPDDQVPLPLDDEANSPIVLPRPGSIIRRTARTKIRKGGPGEGNPRRFSAQRSRHGARLASPIDGDESPRPSFEDLRPASERWSDDQPRDQGDRGSDETGSEERSSESPGTSAESNEAKLADTSIVSSVATEETTGSTDDDEALIFDAYAHERTSSTASSVSDYDTPSRSPSPDHTHARPAPIATPKASDANWYEDDELTPTQDSPMSAALHAMTLLPSAGPSDDIFMQDTAPQSSTSSAHQTPIYPPAAQAPPSPPEAKSHHMRIDTRPGTLAPGAAPRPPGAKSPTEYSGSGLPPGMASPVRISPSPIKSESSEYSPTPPPSAGPPAVVVERPPLMRVDSAASSVSTISGREREKEKEKVKEKDRHRLFGKKDKKDKEKEKKREKDGFLGSLFGSKKKAEDTSSVSNFATAGPAAAAALLGTSKSAKSLHASGASSPTSPAFNNFARYPIHVERAVYRLSHIKLANARRPLIEQVLISNLMFWYLGVIGRNPTQNEEKKGVTNGLDKNRDESARNPQLKGTPPVPADMGSAGVKKDDPPPRVSSKPEHARAAANEPIYRGPSPPSRDMHSPPQAEPVRQQPQAPAQQQQPHPQPPQQSQPQQQPQSPHRQQQPSRQPVVHPQGQQYPASGSMSPRSQSAPARQRSPPHSQQPPREYPPGVAPPRIPPQGQYGPPQGRPMSGDPRDPRQQRQPGGGAHHGQQMGSSRQGQGYQNGPRQEQRHGYPHNKHAGPQPGQIFQYPGGGAQHPRPPGAGGPQPGQLFSAAPQGYQQQQFQQQQQQQHSPQQANWQPPQRLPSGGHGGNHANHSGHQQQRVPPGAAMVENPPRRTSSNPNAGGAYYGREEQQHFYAANNQRPSNQYQYVPAPPGTSRQPVPSGQQYPHHR